MNDTIENAGAVALDGGTVNVTGTFAAGRDITIGQLIGGWDVAPADPADVCPFPGLRPFTGADAEFFFGRDEDARAVRRLAVPGALAAVVGSSGSGKSSLLAAAVVPALAAGGDDRARLLPVVIKPGPQPVELLAGRLADLLPDLRATDIARSLRADPGVLSELSDRAADAAGAPLLWVVDQFEEIFDPVVPDADRMAVLEGLHPGARSGVLLALRSDFYQHLDASPELARRVAERQHRLTPLTPAALRDVITGPAERVHLGVEKGLVDLVTKDAERSGGALPFVAVALKETWAARSGGALTVAGYLAGGGVSGAIQKTADGVWERLAREDRPTARRMLLRLARISADGAATRRRCPVTDFVTAADDEATVIRVLEPLIRSRLLTVDAATPVDDEAQSPVPPVPTVEIAHDALLWAWPQLHEWLVTDRETRRLQDDLAQAAVTWRASKEDPAFLYTGVRLAALTSASDALTPNAVESSFLRASKRLARKQRRRGRLLIALPIGIVIAALVAGMAVVQQRATARAKTLSDALGLAAAGRAESNDDRSLAVLLAAAADRTERDPTTWGTLIDTLADTRGPVAWIRPTMGSVNALAPRFTAGGGVVAAGSDGTAEIRDPSDGRALGHIATGSPLVGVDTSGALVLAVAVDGAMTLAPADGVRPPLLRLPAEAAARAVVLDTSHRLIVAAGVDSRLRRWWYSLAPDGTARLTRRQTVPLAATSLAVDPSGGVLASTLDGGLSYLAAGKGAPGPVSLLDVRTLAGGVGSRIALTRSSVLAAVDGTGLIAWDLTVRAGRAALQRQRSVSYRGGSAIVADPVSGGVVTGTSTGEITAWSVAAEPARGVTLSGGGHDPVTALATDGHRVAARTGAGLVVGWDLDGQASPAVASLPTGVPEPTSAATANDGRIAVGGVGGDIVVRPGPGGAGPGTPVRVGDLGGAPVVSVAWWGRQIAAGGQDGSVVAFDPGGARSVISPPRPVGVTSMAAAGDRLAIGWADGRVDVLGGNGPATQLNAGGTATSLALSSDGRWLACGTDDANGSQVLLWDLSNGGSMRRLTGHHLFVAALAFAPGGRTLASGSDDQDIRLWSVDTGAQLGVLTGHLDTVRALAFTTDGGALVSTGDEGSMRFWDVAERRQIGHPVPLGGAPRLSLTAAPDGRSVVAAGDAGVVVVPLAEDAWVARACSYAGRSFTSAERALYLPGSATPSTGTCP